MKRFTTLTQRKILKFYWEKHTPFSVTSLIDDKILHFPSLGKQTLRLMESRGQIIEHHKRNGEILYIATTESPKEWADIWVPEINTRLANVLDCYTLGRMNRYEREKLFDELNELIWEYEHQDDDAVPQKV